jgi:hypothetical protein
MADVPASQQFQYITLPIPVNPIVDPDGNTMNTSVSTVAITQWMDAALAAAWVAEAQRVSALAVVAAGMNGCMTPPCPGGPGDSPGAEPAVYQDQNNDEWGAIYRGLYAIMQVYNALNIPWYMDPEARRLWRLYISGQPSILLGTSPDVALYGQQDYSSAWATNSSTISYWPTAWVENSVGSDNQWPRGLGPAVATGDPSTGGIAPLAAGDVSIGLQMLAAQTSQFRGQPFGSIRLTPTAWPFIQIPPAIYVPGVSATDDRNPAYYQTVENTVITAKFPPFAGFLDARLLGGGHYDPSDNFLEIPSATWKSVLSPTTNLSNTASSLREAGESDLILPGVGTASDWRWYTVDSPDIGYNRMSVPLVYYTNWLADWTASLAARAPADVVSAARVYTAYTVAKQSIAWFPGNPNQLFSSAGMSDATLAQQQASSSTTKIAVQAAAQLVGIVGAALSSVTYGISGLVGAAIAGGLMIASAEITSPTRGYRDDLGRFKPVIDRGWLAGNPNDGTSAGMPPISVPAPNGWVRPPQTQTDIVSLMGNTGSGIVIDLVGAGIVAGLGYGGYRLFQSWRGGQAKRNSRSRRR